MITTTKKPYGNCFQNSKKGHCHHLSKANKKNTFVFQLKLVENKILASLYLTGNSLCIYYVLIKILNEFFGTKEKSSK